MPRYFQYVSHLQYVFHILAVYFISTNSLIRPEGYLSGIGFGVALLGIGFTVGSLSDIEVITKKEKDIFSNPEKFKKHARAFLTGTCIVLLTSLFFISIKFLNPSLDSAIAEQYTNLGYGCLALAFGVFFDLKQVFEKRIIYMQQEKK